MTPTIEQIAKVLYETMPMARREQVIESAKEILKLLNRANPHETIHSEA